MEAIKKKNIRSSMRNLAVNEVLEFERGLYRPGSIRSTAYMLLEDFGSSYSVNVRENRILVTRKK